MPSLTEVLEKRKSKPFSKKAYRPWDLTGTNENINDNPPPKKEELETVHKEEERFTNGSPNLTQTVHKRFTKPDTNGSQTVHKEEERFTNGSPNLTQTVHKRFTKPDTKNTFSSLSGVQRSILLALFNNCKLNGERITQPMTIEYISSISKCNKKSVKTSIFRLKSKNYISISEYKNGRSGWVKYEIEKDIFSEISQIINLEITENGSQTVHKRFTKPNTEPNTNPSSSSNIYINNKTTTTAPPENSNSLSEDWKKIDCESLSSIGFGLTQLKQLQELKIHPDIIQTSIHHFAFSLEHNEKAKSYSNPLNVLMGILRKGQVWFEPDYRSAQELALETILKTKTAERERLKALEEKCHALAFSEWLDSISEEEKKAITSKNKMIPKEVCLRLHFTENLWEQKKPEYGIK